MITTTFFLPGKGYGEEAEQAYLDLALHNDAPVNARRICGLEWQHNGMAMSCEVGGSLPVYFETGDEPVLSIFDRGDHYIICTLSRGVENHVPVYAGKSDCQNVHYFANAL